MIKTVEFTLLQPQLTDGVVAFQLGQIALQTLRKGEVGNEVCGVRRIILGALDVAARQATSAAQERERAAKERHDLKQLLAVVLSECVKVL